ncbi:signal recognition particle-docking protein FtsY [Stackebrandtia nassauensis]|uniref:Signal recognition particle receptor FtsY n=1 Tax=Stackebrandtia nassauensis (strain DSM 44728 / CIP 108903 / NRRL B-16338 / NBRC 102104 / LLR-40K-21) TaxID=446470 RepID=D3Q1V2_STANL|nr:signal recognition particle-docking protein FtsY [Stackebrandtia nassauensis]ADD41819.1 signal recognition particle-docking protein FtsY [Stackebrandtia nassauensis DSM 44728]
MDIGYWIGIGVAVVAAIAVVVFLVMRGRKAALPEEEPAPPVTKTPAETEPKTERETKPKVKPVVEDLDVPEPTAGRLVRLRARLSKSNNSLGRGLLTLLSRDRLDDDAWEEIEETLLMADVGLESTNRIVERLRERVKVLGTRTAEELRGLLSEELTAALDPSFDRALNATGDGERPAVLLVVGVNGAGKTTTCGKIARVLIADGHSVVLGAADTFRAAAADQLETWGKRVGSTVVRGPEGGDPASVAFDAVKTGTEQGADSVLVDTAGRLQNKTGLMDELGKVKRVIEKQGPVAETLLIIDATTGQNGLEQARVFTEVCQVTGVVLTKLDGTAKGGIVIAVQQTLGVPVKLIGLGEGPDDLAPFDVQQFVDALLDDSRSVGGLKRLAGDRAGGPAPRREHEHGGTARRYRAP